MAFGGSSRAALSASAGASRAGGAVAGRWSRLLLVYRGHSEGVA